MNKYEAPKMEVIELVKNDVIMTSGGNTDIGGGADAETGGGGNLFD